MNSISEPSIYPELVKAIQGFIDEQVGKKEMYRDFWFGAHTAELMADAALAALECAVEAQQYAKLEGYIEDID